MMPKPLITEETFIRHLPYSAVLKLASILDIDDLWERLAVIIPVNPDQLLTEASGHYEFRYTAASMAKIGAKSSQRGGSCTKSLILNWGTQNSKIKHLIEALSRAELYSAADYLRHEVIQGNQSNEPQQNSAVSSESNNMTGSSGGFDSQTRSVREVLPSLVCPDKQRNFLEFEKLQGGELSAVGQPSDNASSVNVSQVTRSERLSVISGGNKSDDPQGAALGDTRVAAIDETATPDQDDVLSSLNLDHLKEIRYKVLQAITHNFDSRPYRDGGNLIGEGGFGKVYIGIFNNGYKIAIKCMNEDTELSLSQFKTEVEMLVKVKHDNLVHLLGYSTDGDVRCLAYQYMSQGSLEDRLVCRNGTQPLSNNMRLEIAKGTARGIVFLHENGITHRDIKTANILLDAEFNPKVGDFATARIAPNGMTTTILKTSMVVGTTAYMAPEAITSFSIHPGLDTFSFGVVILELLTGLPVVDMSREDVDLKLHVQNHCCEGDEDEEAGTIFDLLDTKGGNWDVDVVNGLYSLSSKCLEIKYKLRPKMIKVLQEMVNLTGKTAEDT